MLRQLLEKEHSKKQTKKVVSFIGSDPFRFKELIALLQSDEGDLAQRAAWVLSVAIENGSEDLLKPYHAKLVKLLSKRSAHPAVRRNILRLYQFSPIPKNIQGRLTDVTFKLLLSGEEPVAVKAFGMTVLMRIALQHPELKDELIAAIEQVLAYNATAGLRSRAKRVLKALGKLKS